MSEETAVVAEPVKEPVASQEEVRAELVENVTKMLGEPDTKPETTPETTPDTEPGAKPETPPKGEGEEETAKDETLSTKLQTRAKEAGLSEDLAKNLHQSGQLEETLAAFDRSMIQYVQSKEAKPAAEPPKDEGKRDKQPPPKDQDVPALDPEVYDEELVKRDAYQQSRIEALESQLQGLIDQQQGGFDEWFDNTLKDLGLDTSDDEKCQEVFKAYGAVCTAFSKGLNARDKAMVERAYVATYPEEVFKRKQQQTVDRLRDASGKFLSSPKPKGGPPPKGATDEEIQGQLVSDVTAYLKEQGVQMSGY